MDLVGLMDTCERENGSDMVDSTTDARELGLVVIVDEKDTTRFEQSVCQHQIDERISFCVTAIDVHAIKGFWV